MEDRGRGVYLGLSGSLRRSQTRTRAIVPALPCFHHNVSFLPVSSTLHVIALRLSHQLPSFCSLWRNLVYTRPEMIRRTPTLIALSDNDVQDVREEIQRHVAAMQSQGTPEPSALKNEEYKKAEEERKKKAAQTKEQRLGL